MKTLKITRERLNRIVELDEEIRQKHVHKDDLITAVEKMMAWSTDTVRKDFQDFINDLSVEEKRELSAIVYLGRGDFRNFNEAYEHATGFDNDAVSAPDYFQVLSVTIPAGVASVEKEGIKIN